MSASLVGSEMCIRDRGFAYRSGCAEVCAPDCGGHGFGRRAQDPGRCRLRDCFYSFPRPAACCSRPADEAVRSTSGHPRARAQRELEPGRPPASRRPSRGGFRRARCWPRTSRRRRSLAGGATRARLSATYLKRLSATRVLMDHYDPYCRAGFDCDGPRPLSEHFL
eukprot:541455-Alexandrium_andersonii.AAC.1